jgi:hypothetical protein
MHWVKFWVAAWQLLLPHDCCWVDWDWTAAAWGEASAGAEEPPPKKPPMAWPMEEPTATPLG